MYAPLHCHTAIGSIKDSILKIDDFVKKAKSLGLTHIAMTDHGSMAALVEFHEKCVEKGITGIIGMEAYVVPDKTEKDRSNWHLVLLAKNKEGVKNLIRIHNDAQLNGMYYKPRTDYTTLAKYGKSIIALSACVGGEIPQMILAGMKEGIEPQEQKAWMLKAVEAMKRYQSCFDDFYLEIQPGHFDDQIKVNNVIVQMARAYGVPLVATNDIHYLNAEDYLMHNVHVQSFRKDDGEALAYPDKCYYLMTEQELNSYFIRTKHVTDEVVAEAIENTNKIAAQCDGEVDYDFKMPEYQDLPEGETEDSWLVKLCQKELNRRLPTLKNPAAYEERLLYELDVITKLHFSGYFLIVYDFLNAARRMGVSVGPGRGSVGGSLVAWLLDFSVADPIKHHLMFERFLNPHRKGFPDVDTDFSDTDAMKAYIVRKYGREHCALVGTYGIRKAKAAIKAAGRFLEMDLDTVNAVCKAAPFRVCGDDGEEVKDPTIEQMLDASAKFHSYQVQYPELFSTAQDMESFPVLYGIHAAGIVITPDNILEKMPVRWDEKKQIIVSLIDKNSIEHLAIKYDFLSLATQAIVDKTIKDAHVNFDWNDDAFFEDDKVWDSIGTSNTIGMFQISSALYRQRMPRLKPRNLADMAACIALVRGPCISSGTDKDYMDILEGKKLVASIDSRYDEVTRSTNGICIYQEQLMKIAVAYGMTQDEADQLRKAVSKKKRDKIAALKTTFYKDAAACGTSQAAIDKIWEIIKAAGAYSFNASHAMSYGILVYTSAWLKYHYPPQFMANTLTNAYESGKDEKRIEEMVQDCQRLGIRFLPIDARKSKWEFAPEGGKLRIGLCALKAFGDAAMQELEEARAASPDNIFDGIYKFLTTKGSKLDKRNVSALIFSGAFDYDDEADREQLLQRMLNSKASTKKEKEFGVPFPEKFSPCNNCDLRLDDDPADIEQKLLRVNYLHRPGADLDPIGFNQKANDDRFSGVVQITSVRHKTDKNGREMAFVDLAASDCHIDGIIFGSTYAKIDTSNVRKGKNVRIFAKKQNDDECIIFKLDAV